jgi:hypothetical protein
MRCLQTTTFVSYRRDDSGEFSHALAEHLRRKLGSSAVFIDTVQIRGGERFADRIEQELNAALALVVVIGPEWATIERDGMPRLQHEDDWVRTEIRTALGRGIPIHPVQVVGPATHRQTTQSSALPSPAALPEDIRGVLGHNVHRVSVSTLARDSAALVRSIRRRRNRARLPCATAAAVAAALALVLLMPPPTYELSPSYSRPPVRASRFGPASPLAAGRA